MYEEMIECVEGKDIVFEVKMGVLIGFVFRLVKYWVLLWLWVFIDGLVRFFFLSYSNLVCWFWMCYNILFGSDIYGWLKDGFMDIDVSVVLLF